jgi:hypothetical protein
VFPNVDAAQRVQGPGWSECAKQGLAHKPRKGDALLFYRCDLRAESVGPARHLCVLLGNTNVYVGHPGLANQVIQEQRMDVCA